MVSPTENMSTPQATYQARNIDAALLVTAAHGEVLIELVKVVLGVFLGDGLQSSVGCHE